MNLTRVPTWEVGEADSNLLRFSSSKRWRNVPGAGTSVQTNTTAAIEASCPASALCFVTRGCHQLEWWPTALQDAELWGCVVRWQLFFHGHDGVGEERQALQLPQWNRQKMLASVRPSGECGTEASHCICLILKHVSRTVCACEPVSAQLSSQRAGFAQNTPSLLWDILFPSAETMIQGLCPLFRQIWVKGL